MHIDLNNSMWLSNDYHFYFTIEILSYHLKNDFDILVYSLCQDLKFES